jgi:hypothetical protein
VSDDFVVKKIIEEPTNNPKIEQLRFLLHPSVVLATDWNWTDLSLIVVVWLINTVEFMHNKIKNNLTSHLSFSLLPALRLPVD